MDIQKLRNQLIIDEGVRYRIYFDTKGRATMGIGHLITRNDPEYIHAQDLSLKKVSRVTISKERVDELFKEDIEICLGSCRKVFPKFDKMKEKLQLIIANMMFNLGITKFEKFEKLIAAINKKDYCLAADEMKNSLWCKEVKGRGTRLCQEMRSLEFCRFTNLTECQNVISERAIT
jgi:GH24 family phage-related lysozyme (muramidase)